MNHTLLNAKHLKTSALMVAGTLLIAAANTLFFTPNMIVCGGVSGISTILFHVCKIPLSISYAVINIVLVLIGLRVLGKEFIIKTLIGTVLLSGFTEIMAHLPVVTENTMLATIFGGLAYGIGLGIVFVSGSTTGGTDIVGRLIQIKHPHVSIGILLMMLDIMVIGISLIVFRQIDLVLFGFIGVFLQTIALEFLIRRLNVSKLVFIISDHGEKICDDLIKNFPRGVTIIDAHGGYNRDDKQLLLCALKMDEITELQNTINRIDENAFVIFAESQFIMGNGFRIYK